MMHLRDAAAPLQKEGVTVEGAVCNAKYTFGGEVNKESTTRECRRRVVEEEEGIRDAWQCNTRRSIAWESLGELLCTRGGCGVECC